MSSIWNEIYLSRLSVGSSYNLKLEYVFFAQLVYIENMFWNLLASTSIQEC